MLWICLTAWAGLFIWYFRMRKKAEDHKLVRRIFCLAATGFIAGTALCLPIGVRKVSEDEKAELQLERGALGSQPTEEKLEVSVGNQGLVYEKSFYKNTGCHGIAAVCWLYSAKTNSGEKQSH